MRKQIIDRRKNVSKYAKEIEKRRTFAIISHPDAGKTTLTEKFLLYGGAINLAGSVKGKATARHAVSDWMEIEKERGISVTSSVLQFHYDGYCINILDTPGHQDFSEDTYRTLMAADSAVMVIDGSKGVEAQTRKLFKVCVMRHIPIFTFINKMDRDANDTFDLLDEIEKELGIATCPINWPIGSGKKFRGVYDRNTHKVLTFSDTQKGTKEGVIEEIDIDDARLDDIVDPDQREQLMEEIELLDGASVDFDQEQVSKGNMTPVFFGSALTNFGVETFLEHFLKMTTSPLPRVSDEGEIDPMSDDFSAFVFKIQANMNKAHRDRIAFMRICSGKFDASQEVYHVQGDKKMRLLQPQQMMAESRHVVDEAYAGDIIGVFDPGIFSIGDTICAPGKKFAFEGIPTFAPEHFARVRQIDTMKRKQFVKGINQIAQEGAIQIFQEFNTGMEEIIVGVVGVLQFDVLKYRLENEYNVEIRLENLPYEHIRWIANKEEVDVAKIVGTSDMKKVTDLKGNPLLLFVNAWSVGMTEDRNPDLVLTEFSK
nr:peptide chain release factor 3 [Blautia obeum]